ncbi:MAG TPA: hypothetical protein VNA28_08010 [Solirubrobacteraceae bacterium]|nr:hypothetical protein [Solirubrobacteraceae bacterium]
MNDRDLRCAPAVLEELGALRLAGGSVASPRAGERKPVLGGHRAHERVVDRAARDAERVEALEQRRPALAPRKREDGKLVASSRTTTGPVRRAGAE